MTVVGIDLDDTLSNTSEPLLAIIESRKGRKLGKNEIYGIFYNKLESEDLTRSEIIEMTHKLWKDYKKIEILDKRIPEITDRLRSLAKIYIITFNTSPMISEWLNSNSVKYDKLIVCNGTAEKLREEIGIYVEDSKEVAEFLAENGKKVILMEKPWHDGIPKSANIIPARNWGDVERELLRMLSKTSVA